jgi:hypothetical protein
MTKEEIEQRFANAGWDLDGSCAEHLVIGYKGERIALLVHKESWETDDASFELLELLQRSSKPLILKQGVSISL